MSKHLRVGVAAAICILELCGAHPALALKMRNRYSPKDGARAPRTRTDYIILHTTEGPAAGSLKKVWANGETHYFVDTDGTVYRVIHKDRVAYHCGRSMWDKSTNLDRFSVGIEVVGYHNGSITSAQYGALRELVDQLQRLYKVPDERVLTHSMVAYGAPNRWHSKSHRGRKRCGMLFAKRSVRLGIGLDRRPSEDPDVKAGRLVIADASLERVLFGDAGEQDVASAQFASGNGNVIRPGRSAWDIARDRYGSSDVLYVFPDGRRLTGNQIHDWQKIPPGTTVTDQGDSSANASESVREIGVDGDTAWDIAGDEYAAATTVYFFPDRRVLKGNAMKKTELDALPRGTLVLVGYTAGGSITASRSAFDICGEAWSAAATFYRFPDGTVRPGDTVDEKAIPRGTLLYFQP